VAVEASPREKVSTSLVYVAVEASPREKVSTSLDLSTQKALLVRAFLFWKLVMELRRIKEASYQRLSAERPQVLTKNRGYGVLYFRHGEMIFALPLRSNLNHPNGLRTIFDKRAGQWNGVDYSKALIVDPDDLLPEAFKPKNSAEYDKIKANSEKIKREFFEYLAEYIVSIREGKELDRKFHFTTLQYFHRELGLNL